MLFDEIRPKNLISVKIIHAKGCLGEYPFFKNALPKTTLKNKNIRYQTILHTYSNKDKAR